MWHGQPKLNVKCLNIGKINVNYFISSETPLICYIVASIAGVSPSVPNLKAVGMIQCAFTFRKQREVVIPLSLHLPLSNTYLLLHCISVVRKIHTNLLIFIHTQLEGIQALHNNSWKEKIIHAISKRQYSGNEWNL